LCDRKKGEGDVEVGEGVVGGVWSRGDIECGSWVEEKGRGVVGREREGGGCGGEDGVGLGESGSVKE
jgi:hypothetical protein